MARIPLIDLDAEAREPLEHGETVSDYTVVDVDAHFLAPVKDIVEYMDEPWRTRLSQVLPDTWSKEAAEHAPNREDAGPYRYGSYSGVQTFLPGSTGDREQYGKVAREHTAFPHAPQDETRIPDSMEFLGVDKQIQISHMMLFTAAVQADDRRVSQFFRAYVDYLRDHVIDPSQGIYGFVPLDPNHLDTSLELLEIAADEEGLLGGVMLTAGSHPPLGNPKYDPVYEFCEDEGMPIAFHTSGSGLDAMGGFTSFIETHTAGFLQSNQNQLISLVFQGVPERFPGLDMVVVESGITYIPALAARMDEEWLKRTEEAPMLTQKPSEYLQEHFYYSTQPLEASTNPALLEACFDMFGDRLMYASDYPHWDFDPPKNIVELPFLDEEEKKRILGGNAIEVWDL